jgi:hypothetical protein
MLLFSLTASGGKEGPPLVATTADAMISRASGNRMRAVSGSPCMAL